MTDSLVTIMRDSEDTIFWMRVAYCVGCALFALCTISLIVIASQLERGVSALWELVEQGRKKTEVETEALDDGQSTMLRRLVMRNKKVEAIPSKNILHGEPTPPPKNRET